MFVNQKMIVLITLVFMSLLLWLANAQAHQAWSNDASLMVREAAIRHHVPVDFALRVARQETGGKGGRCGLRGAAGEVGPLQILPATARGMGYRGVVSATCEAQVDAGMAHLAKCWRHFRVEWMAAACHNQGHGTIRTGKFVKAAKRYAASVTGAAVKTTEVAVKTTKKVAVKTAKVTVEAVSYPVRAMKATKAFVVLMTPEKGAVPVRKIVYRCNWSNCSI